MEQIDKVMTEAIDKLKESTEEMLDEGVLSDCCGASPVGESEDIGICPECKEHCDYLYN